MARYRDRYLPEVGAGVRIKGSLPKIGAGGEEEGFYLPEIGAGGKDQGFY